MHLGEEREQKTNSTTLPTQQPVLHDVPEMTRLSGSISTEWIGDT